MRSVPARAPTAPPKVRRPSVASRSAAAILPFSTNLPRLFSIVARARSSAAVAAAQTEGGDAALLVPVLQRVEQCGQDARAGSADRVAEGDGSAVHVDAC